MRNPAKFSGNRSRLAAGAALIAAFGLAASACAGGGSTTTATSSGSPVPSVTGPVTITFQEVYGSKSQLATITKVVDAFEAKYPDIKVNLEASSNYIALFEKEDAEVAAGNTPTIGMAYESYAQTWSNAQKIVPIKDLAGTNTPAEFSTFYTGVQNDLKLSDGNTWMWPLGKSLQLQAINETMLTAAGITSAPTTWAEWATDLEAVATKEKATDSKFAGLTVYPMGSGETLLEELAAGYGEKLYASDGTPQFTSADAVKAMQFLQTEKTNGALAVGGSTTNLYPGESALTGGTGVEDITSSAGVNYEEAPSGDTLEFAALPGESEMQGANLVVYSTATTQQRAAAWDLLQYLASPSTQATWSQGIGYYPVTSQALSDMSSSYLSKNPWIQQTIGNLNTAFTDPPYGWVTECGIYLETAVSSALSGTSASSALQTAQTACAAKQSAEG
jgi:multiple sugar transport system substrate-binding protein